MSGNALLYGVIGEFTDQHKLVHAAHAARERGYTRLDAFSPFPVHGLDRALGIGRSKLGFIVAVTGVMGGAAALALQWWTSVKAYPLHVGGKPLFAIEPSIPIIFELSVLLAAFGAALGMIALNGLPRFYHPAFNWDRFKRVSDDRFFLAIEADDKQFDASRATEFLRAAGAVATEVVES
jgi:hypothetical protein